MGSIRRDNTVRYVTVIIALFIISLFYLGLFFKKSNAEYINYTDKMVVDYDVYLKDNNYYDSDFRPSNKEYVASLIDYIKTKYIFNLVFDKEVNYEYSYDIILYGNIYNKDSNNSLYSFEESLSSEKNIKNTGNLKLKKEVDIDYSKYNDMVKKFINDYKVVNTKSELKIVMIFSANGVTYNNKKMFNIKNKKVANIVIPLNEQTISLDISKEINSTIGNKYLIGDNYNDIKWLLLVSATSLLLSIIVSILLILYRVKTLPYQKIYNKKLKNIYNNFSVYVQKVENGFSMGPTKPIFVKEFTDILAIGMNLKRPILTMENNKKNGTLFIVPPENGIAFAYLLSIKSLKDRKEGKNILPSDYDDYIEEFMVSKYTKEKIEKTIMETKKMPIFDKNEIIDGASNVNELYKQFDKSLDYIELEKNKEINDNKEKNKKNGSKNDSSKKESKKVSKKKN